MCGNPFRYFKTSPEIIRLVVMLYVRFPLSLRNVEDLLDERGIDVSQETVRYWWNRFGPIFAAEIRRKRARHLHAWPQWRWHLDEMFVASTARSTTFGVPSTTKVKPSKPMLPRVAIVRQR
jgi:putative transposase